MGSRTPSTTQGTDWFVGSRYRATYRTHRGDSALWPVRSRGKALGLDPPDPDGMGISPKPPVPGFRRKGRIAGPHSARRTGRILPIPGQDLMLLCLRKQAPKGPNLDRPRTRAVRRSAPSRPDPASMDFRRSLCSLCLMGGLTAVQRAVRPTSSLSRPSSYAESWPTYHHHLRPSGYTASSADLYHHGESNPWRPGHPQVTCSPLCCWPTRH